MIVEGLVKCFGMIKKIKDIENEGELWGKKGALESQS